ncbi:ABC transporter ATP-binding protein [uncultured Methanobrevibacter sp.]|uniref:ATP-binding cassette domain-containing protein n=1 Tax=uncultured Methanobrevibacter sp. TaxID=253161 RepID=UPI0025CE24B3|nr:ABC transporter ATP-binding protein [uncultured Methanobrevibacter sp.]
MADVDDTVFVSLYIVYLINHLFSLAPFVSIYPLSYTSAVRIEEVLALENISSDSRKENDFDGIEFKNVSLKLSDRQILSDISFKISNNSNTLIVGPVGSGKTALVYSLMGFHTIDSGELFIDKNAKVSLTTNKVFLFKDDVFENIALGDDHISREDAVSACNDALFTKDLSFEVNENGNNLTYGSKQKLSIARALAHNYDLYIFDNAFTSIDSDSKRVIKENIKRRLENKTVIFIDNDFDDYSCFDNILVLDKGRLVSQGRHDELIKTCDTYKKLFDESWRCNDG